ncbi:MAG TPA: hypothetical protein VIV60_11315 [Polyangiaceae bacterium]
MAKQRGFRWRLGVWLAKHPQWAVLGALELALLACVSVPFFRHNALLRHDLIGHLASAAFTEAYLLPAVSGYNPYYYCGAPQNLLYPPLLAYASAVLGRGLGIAWALKLLIVISVGATPIAVYCCARAHELARGTACLATIVMTAALALWPEELGGNFIATFETGNAANALGLPLFLGYAASLGAWRKRPTAVVVPTALLALSLLAHLVGGIVALMLLAVHAGILCVQRRAFWLKHVGWLTLHAGWALLLSGFFVVPMLAFRRYGAQGNISYNQYPDSLLGLIVAVAVLLGWYSSRRSGREGLLPLALLSGILLLGRHFVFNDYFPQDIGLHVHRFKLYEGLASCLLATWLVDGWVSRMALFRRVCVGVATGAIASVALVMGLLNIDAKGPVQQAIPMLPRLPSRVMVLSSPQHQASDHGVQHLVPMRTGNAVAKGLFIESAANARYLVDLERMLVVDPSQVRTWGISLDSMQRLEPLRPDLRKLLALFGFGFVLSNEALHPESGLLPLEHFADEFVLYRANYAQLAEIWTGAVRGVSEREFGTAADHWFFEQPGELAVDLGSGERWPPASAASKPSDDQVVVGKPSLRSVRISASRPQVVMDITSDVAVPVLVKLTYAPQFTAHDERGLRLPVYRVTPNFMLVMASGRVTMDYEMTSVERRCLRTSELAFAALLLTAFVAAWRRRKHAKSSRTVSQRGLG